MAGSRIQITAFVNYKWLDVDKAKTTHIQWTAIDASNECKVQICILLERLVNIAIIFFLMLLHWSMSAASS